MCFYHTLPIKLMLNDFYGSISSQAVINRCSIRDEARERKMGRDTGVGGGQRRREEGETERDRERDIPFELTAAPCSRKLRCDFDFYSTSPFFYHTFHAGTRLGIGFSCT